MNDTRKALQGHCEYVRKELRSVIDGESKDYEDIYEYLSDVLDVEYRLDSSFNLRGVEVSVTLGGPNVWIDTYAETVEGAWGTERVSLCLDRDICSAIDDYYEDYINAYIHR